MYISGIDSQTNRNFFHARKKYDWFACKTISDAWLKGIKKGLCSVSVQSYSRNKHKAQDHGGSEQKSQTHDSWEYVDKVHESVCWNNDDSQHNTGDVDGTSNVQWVVQTLHFHFSCAEGKQQSKDLQKTFVTVEDGV